MQSHIHKVQKTNHASSLRKAPLILSASIALAGCGGGGGGTTPVTPAPTVTLSLSAARIAPGAQTTLTWSSTNATACAGLAGVSGALATSGSISVTGGAEGGVQSYVLRCDGAGGSASASADLIVPHPATGSSYANRQRAGDPFAGQSRPAQNASFPGTFADFFQEGSWSFVNASLEYDAQKPISEAKPGHIRFWRQVNGTWQDRTSDLLDDTTGCIHPRKLIVADFNGDGRPDVFLACHGYDAPPYPGEQARILLSRADGRYDNTLLPFSGYYHGASAADLDGDGKPDIIVADTYYGRPYALMNQGNGSFVQDLTRVPASLQGKGGIYSVELIDTGHGVPDLFVGSGTPPGSDPANPAAAWALPNGYLRNDGTGHFTDPLIALPNSPGSTGIVYGLALDFVLRDGWIYFHQINNTWGAADPFYNDVIVRKVRMSDLQETLIYEHRGPYSDGGTWFPWITVTDTHVKGNCDWWIGDTSKVATSSCGVSFPR
ncbi:VCBS repeat-containing protein [Niveibacterium sp. COAC-50]|uniref:FG-GAP repeat domain-containing protein n=1 Tax=Niveibacterium sp. COAC-50 TaxID=2729384 RepID=UPI0015574B16|nr:VCBS repeat-containing protein [Niveibacterium sp. COAC-50]